MIPSARAAYLLKMSDGKVIFGEAHYLEEVARPLRVRRRGDSQ